MAQMTFSPYVTFCAHALHYTTHHLNSRLAEPGGPSCRLPGDRAPLGSLYSTQHSVSCYLYLGKPHTLIFLEKLDGASYSTNQATSQLSSTPLGVSHCPHIHFSPVTEPHSLTTAVSCPAPMLLLPR